MRLRETQCSLLKNALVSQKGLSKSHETEIFLAKLEKDVKEWFEEHIEKYSYADTFSQRALLAFFTSSTTDQPKRLIMLRDA